MATMRVPSTMGPVRRPPQPFTGPGHAPCRKSVFRVAIRCKAEEDPKGGDGGLSGVFNQFVFLKGIKSPAVAAQRPNPSPLMPPTAVLEKVMAMLQRNDWPEPDSGVRAAFNLTLPAGEEEGAELGSVRSWGAAAEWLPWPRFHALLHVSYNPLLNCDSWRVVSPLVFPSERHDNRAVQAVEVRAAPRGAGHQPQPESEPGSSETALRAYTYTFCWERVATGSYKDCWLIAGVRVGNYAL
ncbi:hypothetical protein PLESTB_001537700 [Pleodorina starrii]|uniref:Uncharacterized protein n=1 Tax=Pleodorina starrii TaxID=330485 RepID=A0A9W6F8P9_9CHLO|nr:hypothetical protein PLESTM_001842900 [Pleodorina starrii]GLC59806.1 hypothetical protein PLESTB_001537700 [Pleodorina starrii]GLC67311.1 hypothetical protein PLESTF_000541100 [Pleodorina starrii]